MTDCFVCQKGYIITQKFSHYEESIIKTFCSSCLCDFNKSETTAYDFTNSKGGKGVTE